VEASLTGPDLQLAVSGRVLRFPAIWLRDNCPCPECVAPGTTQKLKDITDLPNGVAVTRTEHAGDSVMVTFAPDQHRATFSRPWLTAHAPGAAGDDERTEDGKQLWLPVQLLPCLRAAGEGGDTGLVDGFAAAAALRAADAESFGTLTRTPAPFGYIDKETQLRASQPLIELSPRGRVRGAARPARPAAQPAAGARRLPGQHAGRTQSIRKPGA
jgi:hypothetical protein